MIDQAGVNRQLKMEVVNEFLVLLLETAIFQIDDRLLSRGLFNQQIDEALHPAADEGQIGCLNVRHCLGNLGYSQMLD